VAPFFIYFLVFMSRQNKSPGGGFVDA